MSTEIQQDLLAPLPELLSAQIGGAHRTWRSGQPGPGTPMVLLHGIGSNARAWYEQLVGYQRLRAVVAWNAPGYANSTALDPEWPTADDYAAALLDLVDHLELPSFVLVGQSLGAIIATAFALRHSSRVLALVLTSPACGYGSPPYEDLPLTVQARLDELEAIGPLNFAAARAERLLTSAASPGARQMTRRAMAEVELEGYRQACRLLAVSNLGAAVSRLSVPRHVIWGGADVVTPPETCRRVATAAGVPGLEISDVGHAFAIEAPGSFHAALSPVLKEADSRMGMLP